MQPPKLHLAFIVRLTSYVFRIKLILYKFSDLYYKYNSGAKINSHIHAKDIIGVQKLCTNILEE